MAATTHTVDAPRPDLTFHVDESGTPGGEPVVWLHGELGAFDDPPLDAQVLDRCRVLAVHAPGWGTSTGLETFDRIEDLAVAYWWLLDHLGLDGVHLAGHGLGATLAAEIAVQQPQRVRSLTLVAPYGLFREDDTGVDLFGTMPRDLMPSLYAEPAGELAGRHFPAPADAHEKGRASIRRTRVLGAASRFLFPIPDTGIGGRLYRLADVDVTLVWGAQDGLVPVSLAEDWQAHLPAARSIVLDGAAHMVAYERPAEVSAAVAGAALGVPEPT